MTYPNVLVMGYLKETGSLTPEWRMKLEAAINAGYQRLLTFENKGGGFGWYADGAPQTYLTAYGILLLNDMDKVYPIDRRVIERAKEMLYRYQGRDGDWALGENREGPLPLTAYIVWALKEAGFKDEAVRRGEAWLREHSDAKVDAHTRALVALALGDRASLAAVEAGVEVKGDEARWPSRGGVVYHARGDCASIEATALSVLALGREGRSPLIDQGLTAIARSKDAGGSWHSTQATILCIKALLEASKAPAKPPRPVPVRLTVNGKEIAGAFQALSAANHDVVQQVEIPALEGENRIEIEAEGELRATTQVFGRYYLPWPLAPEPVKSPLAIGVAYDREELKLSEKLKATATLRYAGPGTFMVIADLGIPPGFTPDGAPFEELVKKGVIDKFTFTGRQITLYFGKVETGRRIEIAYTLTPRFPIRARTPASRTYEYYTPENKGDGKPQGLRVLEDY